MPARVILADDHPIVLDGLEQLFGLEDDFEVVARCRDGEETLRALRSMESDLVILDIRMPGQSGLEVLRTIREERIRTRVVLLTAALDESQLAEAIQLGARGIVLKEMAGELVVAAAREVHAGGRWLDRGPVGRALERLVSREAAVREVARKLTPRELEVVRMVATGHRNRTIAEKLHIAEGTVKIHLHNIYDKLGVDGRLGLAVYAQTHGLV